jgi:hypothetical protein
MDVSENTNVLSFAVNRTPTCQSSCTSCFKSRADGQTDSPLALFHPENKRCKKKAPSYSQVTAAAAAAAAAAGIYTPLPVFTTPLTSGSISVALSFINWKDTHKVNRLLHMRIHWSGGGWFLHMRIHWSGGGWFDRMHCHKPGTRTAYREQPQSAGTASLNKVRYVISGFHRDGDEICALLRYYAALSGSYVQTFRDKLSVLSSMILDFLTLEDGTDRCSRNAGCFLFWTSWPLKMGPIGCSETSVVFFLYFLILEGGTDRLSRNVG